ncbi:hypothetical protein M407DRAFT_18707 [Tulasnella calospora MUT 4182]|uniref:F-box domain-containing protein n=1 Tax=Tulasnella calospora MUT 4182 TaxID=1051891 RepID=A0A0C3QTC2_9AGAM|nr:hypothetical protein M407DRAFT_18707 [Tulasnella calospora MUT 4182]
MATTKTSDPDETRSVKKAQVDALAVPELLANFFSFATQSTLGTCALVCKLWSEVALDELWKHLDSVFPLLELVMSLELLRNLGLRVPDASQILSSKLSDADWSRFHYYSRKVRSISYDHEKRYRPNSITPAIGPEAIAMLCLHHPSGLEMLPRLETLKWSTNGSTTPILPFLSSRVKSLEVELTGGSQSVDDFFRALAGRTPHLTNFHLKTLTAVKDIEPSLRKAIGTWKKLETLILPPYYLRPSIVGLVASLPNLKTLEHDYTCHPPYDEAAMLQELPENAFPELDSFGFNSNPPSAQRLALKYSGLFTRLTSINIDAANSVGGEEALTFVHHLGSKCVQLLDISLNFCLGWGPQGEVASPLSFRVLESLFPCRKLRMLLVGHPHPLTINETDVERIAAAWPKLVIFELCKEPDLSLPIPEDMGNSLSILPTFARHFPMMKDLGLFFAKDQDFSFSGNLYPKFEFCQLDNLGVGVSAVPKGRSQDVGFLIASLCRVEPTIEIGTSVWFVGPWCPGWGEYQNQWEEAGRFLQFAMRTKIASRANELRPFA